MGWFDFNREEGFPTQYEAKDYPVTVDTVDAGIITTFLILYVCFLIASAGIPGKRNKIFLFIRVTLSLLIGCLLMLGNFGQEWEVGHVTAKTAYRVGTPKEIEADIGVKIGLRSVNVTLLSHDPPTPKEIINYNERFEWTWDQGRFGFGYYAGLIQRQFRLAQHRGLPLPILWIVDYFVIDGEGYRYGRFYRTAGWYCHIALWTAFPCWLLANILFRSVLSYGAYFLSICGFLELLACLLWGVIRNPNPLIIPFDDKYITTSFGTSFYLTLCSGILCVLLAAVIIYMDWYHDVALSIFFGVDPLASYDEYQLTPSEVAVLRKKKQQQRMSRQRLTDMEMGSLPPLPHPNMPRIEQEVNDDDDIYDDPNEIVNRTDENHLQPVFILKRKSTTRRPKLFSRKVVDEDEPIYGNLSSIRGLDPISDYNEQPEYSNY